MTELQWERLLLPPRARPLALEYDYYGDSKDGISLFLTLIGAQCDVDDLLAMRRCTAEGARLRRVMAIIQPETQN